LPVLNDNIEGTEHGHHDVCQVELREEHLAIPNVVVVDSQVNKGQIGDGEQNSQKCFVYFDVSKWQLIMEEVMICKVENECLKNMQSHEQ